jgi:hypothetical protein
MRYFGIKSIYLILRLNSMKNISLGMCAHTSWLITLGGDNWIRIFDYKDNNREIISKHIPDGAYAVTGKFPRNKKQSFCLFLKFRI